jgi:hypothetical protein
LLLEPGAVGDAFLEPRCHSRAAGVHEEPSNEGAEGEARGSCDDG